MFKRLSKARRHSADEIGVTLPSPNEPLIIPRKNSDNEQIQGFNSSLFRVSRVKYARRSCGDATAMQAFLHPQTDEQALNSTSCITMDTDYQMVTAVPAFIVEHAPEKQRGLGVWGRRMSKKIDSFRRIGSRESISTINEKSDSNFNTDKDNNNVIENCESHHLKHDPDSSQKVDFKIDKRVYAQRSPSPFKSFFIRMGSTGMLNSHHSKSYKKSQETSNERLKSTPDKESLFRSCSTSQLNTSPTYVKGDDPSEGIDLQISNRKDKTLSCDNLSTRESDDFEEITASSSHHNFNEFGDGLKKSSSCDFKETRKSSFPYAFLRSKLSVLPEEKNMKEERLFKATSEEHFPGMIRTEDSFETTTLGRRKSRNSSHGNNSINSVFESEGTLKSRNSGADSFRDRHFHTRTDDADAFILSEFQENNQFHQSKMCDLISLQSELDVVAQLRSHRRNSAPCNFEQRLSNHYVSSNESGYDSDGPRGESVTTSENEGISLKCTDSSDTSSVIDSEIEKPMRSSTPSENVFENDSTKKGDGNHEFGNYHYDVHQENIEGLKWHHSNSGRLLPSIHQSSADDVERDDADDESKKDKCDFLSRRMRLQQEKTKFLGDIIEPVKRIRRKRIVRLLKNDPKESLGIRLAQQRLGDIRYIVVQLEHDGIAHKDGRLRLGDEIVEVEGKELKTLDTLEEVQEFLRSIEGNQIHLITAFEETVPQVYSNPEEMPGEYEYFENAKNLSNMSLIDNSKEVENEKSNSQEGIPNAELHNVKKKRPNFLPIGNNVPKDMVKDNVESLTEAQQYLTKHFAKFQKGYGKPSLGFSVVGGRDSPRGEMGIFVRRVFPGGQADVSKALFQGDEILSLNGKILRGYTHQEVIELFKAVREGPVELELARRHRYPKSGLKSAPY